MSKSVFLSDSHLRHHYLDTILSWENEYDKVIYTGDFFDQFSDTPEQNGEAAQWLKTKLDDPKCVVICGNHDFGYMFPLNPKAYCSGFSHEKVRAIRKHLTQLDFRKMHLHHVESGILFSHAGLSRDFFDMIASQGYDFPTPLNLETIDAWLTALWPQIQERYGVGQDHPLMGAGYDRSGRQNVGGIIWKDFSGHCPVQGVGQIVGHTPQEPAKGPLFRFINRNGTPMWRFAAKGVNPQWFKAGWSLDFDTHNKNYLVIENGVLQIKSVTWMRETGQDNYTVSPGETICEVDLSKTT